MRLFRRDESYFHKHTAQHESGCVIWTGPHRFASNDRQVPIARLTKDHYIDAALIGYAIAKRSDIPSGQNYNLTCKLYCCVNGAHVYLYYPNRSGRMFVPLEHRRGHEVQYNGIKQIVAEFPNTPRNQILAKFRAAGGHIKDAAFSDTYHQVREDLELPYDSVGRGRKKVTFKNVI